MKRNLINLMKLICIFTLMIPFTMSFHSSIDVTAITTSYNPTGCVDSVVGGKGTVVVGGWAFDKDRSSTSIQVKVYIGTACLGTLNANQTREDVNKAYGISGKHGFSGILNTTYTGTQTVTIKAVNVDNNTEYTIGSKQITITASSSNQNPKANVEAITPLEGQIKIAGWAYDPDEASTSIDIKAYIGTTCLGTINANLLRNDVNKAYGITGNHGFSGTVSTSLTGTQTITIKAVNAGSKVEYTIATKSVTIPASSTSGTTTSYTTKYDPKANVEAITPLEGQIKIAGWAYDLDDASQSIDIKAYIGSTCLGTLSANLTRADVNNAFGITGDHGFSGTLNTTLTGTQTIIIKAVNVGSNVEYTIATKSITIPSSSSSTTTYTTKYTPTGCVDAVQYTSNKVYVAGWAFDKDSASTSMNVKVYIGTTCLGTLTANQTRDDVNKVYSITGTHGFSGYFTTTLTGSLTVTIKAVDLQSNQEYAIGSKSIYISNGIASVTPAIKNPPVVSTGVTIGSTSNTVIIDAGHGGSDPGCSSGSNIEENITLTYAKAVANYLSSQGINVILTRNGDYELTRSSYTYNNQTLTNDLTSRSMLGKYYNAAIYCSIHIDSYNSSSHGFSCFYQPKYADSKDLANMILSNLSSINYTTNRGLLDGTRLRSMRANTTIAVMVELGFIQSSDITYINSHVDTISQSIGNAIISKLNKGFSEKGKVIIPDLS